MKLSRAIIVFFLMLIIGLIFAEVYLLSISNEKVKVDTTTKWIGPPNTNYFIIKSPNPCYPERGCEETS